MECNKDEAKRAMDIAEKKLSENDYVGAKKFLTKAQNLYPHLDGLNQVSTMIHVYISAANKINGGKESDLYGVLGVDPLADDEALKKQYKKLALLLHPDKNKFRAAEGAFKLVSNAWSLLSDKAERSAYDLRRNQNGKAGSNQPQGPPPYAPKPASSGRNPNASRDGVHPSANARSNHPAPAPAPVNSSKKHSMFWTMCNGCNTGSECWRDLYLNKTIYCHHCGHAYIATEQNPWCCYVTYLRIALSLLLHQWMTSSSFVTSSSPFVGYMTQLDYTVSLLEQQQAQWIAQNQAANNNNTNGGGSSTSGTSYVGATPREKFTLQQVYFSFSSLLKLQQQWSAAAKNNRTPSVSATTRKGPHASFVYPGVNRSSSSSPKQQQQWGGQSTSGGTYYHPSCSSGGNAAKQGQERCKRGREEDSQETIAAIEMVFKKLRRDVV